MNTHLLAINSWILPSTGIKIPNEFAAAMNSPWFWTGASRPRNPCCGIPAEKYLNLNIESISVSIWCLGKLLGAIRILTLYDPFKSIGLFFEEFDEAPTRQSII